MKCASRNVRKKSSWCRLDPRGSIHKDVHNLVAKTIRGDQLERLGCANSVELKVTSCAHVKNLLQKSNIEALTKSEHRLGL